MLTFLDEDMEMDAGQVKRSVEEFGKIVVSITRGTFVRMPSDRDNSPVTLWDGYEAPDVQISSKAVVKDNHVSHAIRGVSPSTTSWACVTDTI